MELEELRYHVPQNKDVLDLLILTGKEASLDDTTEIEEITDGYYNESDESSLKCIFPSFRKEDQYRKREVDMKSYGDGKNKRIIKYERICGSDSPAVIPTRPDKESGNGKKGPPKGERRGNSKNDGKQVRYDENIVEFTEMEEEWGKYKVQIHSIMGNEAFEIVKEIRDELNPDLSEEVKSNFKVLDNLL